MVASSALDQTRDQRDDADERLLGTLADDPSALGVLYDRYSSMVYGLAYAIVGNRPEAEDLTQDVFLALCEQKAYDASRGSVPAFLTTLTRSRAIDRLRRGTTRGRRLRDYKHTEVPAIAPPASPHEQVATAHEAVRVRAAIESLSENERRVLQMAYFEGRTQTEIAEDLDTPLGTVKSWSRRALTSLKRTLGDLTERT